MNFCQFLIGFLSEYHLILKNNCLKYDMDVDEDTLRVLWEYNKNYTWDELISAVSYLNEKGNIDSALWSRLTKLVEDMKQKELTYPQNLELLQQTLNYYLPNY